MKKKYPEEICAGGEGFWTNQSWRSNIHRHGVWRASVPCPCPCQLRQKHPKAFFDAEVLHVWTMGIAPYANETYQSNFRQNSFFIGNDTVREAINKGIADFTPIFLSQVPRLFYRKLVPIDVALIQTSPPDHHGYMSLGVSVDITKAATENATLVIAQVNDRMPRVHGNTFIHLDEVDFIIPHDEPLLEYESQVPDEVAQNIGKYVSQLIEDGDTIQVGYGSLPNAILSNLGVKNTWAFIPSC